MPLTGAGGVLGVEYRHPTAAERHTIHLHLAHFDPTPISTSYGANDRAYIAGGPVVPAESSVLATFAAIAALWQPYFSPTWTLTLTELKQLVSGNRVVLSPLPVVTVQNGTNTADDDTGVRGTRRFRLLGATGAVRHLWLSQVLNPVQPDSPFEVGATSGGLDARDRAWMAYLSGQSGGGAVMPDGTYCFPVTDMRVEWARQLEAASWVLPGSPYIVSGP